MARDDYYVIAYQILSYLYQCLKKGNEVDTKMLQPDSRLLRINETYWQYIIYNLYNDGYVDGVMVVEIDNYKAAYVSNIDDIMITPKGIDYLCEKNAMKKAYKYLKEIKEIVPFNILP